MTRMRRSLYSLAAMYVGTVVTLLSGLVATPILLHYLGEERVGITRTATEWLSYTLLLGFGLDGALNVHFSRDASKQDRAATIATLRGGLRAYFRVALIACVWVTFVNLFADRLFGLGDGNLLAGELQLALLIATAGQFSAVLGAFKPLVDAEQRGYVAQLANATGIFVSFGVSILLAWLGHGLPGQLTAMMVAPLVNGLIISIDVLRRYPEALAWHGPRTPGIRALNPTMLLVHFCSRVCFLSDCILVSLILGQTPVAMFSLTQRLLLLVQGIVGGLGTATWAALADLHHRGEAEAFTRRLLQLTRLTSLLSCAALVPAAVWNGPFVRAWTGKPDLFAGDTLSFLTAFALILLGIVTLWSWPLTTTGRVRKLVPLYLAGATVNVTVSSLATHFLGVIGPPIGAIVNLLGVMTWWYARLIQREFGTPMRAMIFAAGGPILLAIPYAMLLWFLGQQFAVDSIADSRILRLGIVAALMGISAVAFLAIAFSTVIPIADRQEFLRRFRRTPV